MPRGSGLRQSDLGCKKVGVGGEWLAADLGVELLRFGVARVCNQEERVSPAAERGELLRGVCGSAGFAGSAGELDVMDEEMQQLDRRLDRLIARADSPRRAAVVIATVTTAITAVAGVLMGIVDHAEFPTVGTGLWWAVQTVTTVGYGDHVPTSVAGRIVATAVMLLGIGFVTVFTASITSAFVARQRKESQAATLQAPPAETLAEVLERLERIEAALSRRP